MMEKKFSLQLELFKRPNDDSGLGRDTSARPLLNYIRSYEKTILIIIGIVITGIASFSLGVQKGRRVTEIAGQRIRVQAPVIKIEEPKREVMPLEGENYVIQLASYKVGSYARKEAALLKKRGLEPRVLAKGIYTVLCVGNIPNKQTARSLLAELKKRYRDCYLTRL